MIIYILTIAVSVILAWFSCHIKGRINKIIIFCLATIAPILVSMFRYGTGDYLMYLNMMKVFGESGSDINSFTVVKSIEVGFFILMRVSGFFVGDSYFLIFGIIAAIVIGLIFVGIWKQSSNIVLSVFLFFISGIYFDTFNGVRQYIAVAIVFFSIMYIVEGNFKKYIIVILFATLFHYSAIIMLPVYFIRNAKIDFKRALIVAVGCVVGGDILYELVTYILQFTRYKYFLTSIEYEVVPTDAAILYTTIFSFVIFFFCRKWVGEISLKLQCMLNLQLLVWCSALISLTIPLALRIQYYFLPLEIIIIPCFLKELNNKKQRIILSSLIVGVYMVIVGYGIIYNGWYDCYPYKYYFDYI